MPGPAELDCPLDRPGRHFGAMRVPWSHDGSAYGQIVVPLAVIVGDSAGPTALLIAGVHGDEYEGQIALASLARELDPGEVRGRVIIVPCLNPPAGRAGRRTSPIDGGNLARLFPGDAAGTPTAQIAEGATRLLLAEADLVLDLHSGGRSLDYLPCAWGRLPPQADARRRVLDAMLAFGAPIAAVLVQPQATGTLVSTALRAGKTAFASEIGGASTVTPDSLAVATQGIRATLRHAGILEAGPGPSPRSRLVAVRPEHFLRSPGRGLFEPALRLGETVAPGDLAGRLHDIERPDRAPENVYVSSGGFVLCRRVPPAVEAGDVLLHLAEDAGEEEVLALDQPRSFAR